MSAALLMSGAARHLIQAPPIFPLDNPGILSIPLRNPTLRRAEPFLPLSMRPVARQPVHALWNLGYGRIMVFSNFFVTFSRLLRLLEEEKGQSADGGIWTVGSSRCSQQNISYEPA